MSRSKKSSRPGGSKPTPPQGTPADGGKVVDLVRRKLENELAELERKPKLKTVFLKLRDLLKKDAKSAALVRHEIGTHVDRVMTDRKKYGSNAVALLASLLGFDGDSSLYAYAKVARIWSKDQMRKLLLRRTPRGLPITFSHLVALSNEKSEKRRNDLLEEAIAQGWSLRQLETALNKGKNGDVEQAVGPRELRAFRSAIKRWKADGKRFEQQTVKLEKLAVEHPGSATLNILEKSIAEQRSLADRVKECSDRLEKRHHELKRKQTRRAGKVQAPGKSRRQAVA